MTKDLGTGTDNVNIIRVGSHGETLSHCAGCNQLLSQDLLSGCSCGKLLCTECYRREDHGGHDLTPDMLFVSRVIEELGKEGESEEVATAVCNALRLCPGCLGYSRLHTCCPFQTCDFGHCCCEENDLDYEELRQEAIRKLNPILEARKEWFGNLDNAGIFYISVSLAEQAPFILDAIRDRFCLLIIKSELYQPYDAIKYTAICNQFDRLAPGEDLPEYMFTFHSKMNAGVAEIVDITVERWEYGRKERRDEPTIDVIGLLGDLVSDRSIPTTQ